MNSISFASDVLVRDIDQLSYAEWLDVRRSGIGGSDAAAALGLSPWKSRYELYQEKISTSPPPRISNEAMTWGRLLEPLIREEFSKRSGMAVRPLRSMLQHPSYPWMLADLDGLVEDSNRGVGILEIKTSSAFKSADWEDGKVPDQYMLQVQHYMEVCGLDFAIIAVLIGGNRLQWTQIKKDRELVEQLVELERRFWEHVLTQTPPPVDGSTTCAEMLVRKYPTSSNAAPLILPADADDWIRQYWQAKAEEDAAGDRKRQSENRLKDVMQDHERAVSPSGHQVTWKTVQSCRIDTARLKKEEPAILERYASTTSSRRFSVSESK